MTGTGTNNPISLSTVDDFRVPLWPVGRPTEGVGVETPWGTVRFLDGVPSSRHQDALIAIAACSVANKTDEVGRLHILFDMPDVKKMMNCDDWHWLKSKLNELVSMKVELKKKNDDWGRTRTILAGVDDSDVDAPRRKGQKAAKFKEIIFSEITSQLIRDGMLVYMKREVTEAVLALHHPVSRSVARFCLSHSTDQVHGLETVLKAVGCGGGDRMVRKYRWQLHKDEVGLAKLGVTVTNNQVISKRQKGVWFKKTEPLSAGS